MTEQRHTADTITDDALDGLYARAERAERAEEWAEATAKVGTRNMVAAEQAEAAIERVRRLAHRMRAGSPQGAAAIYAERIEQALDDPKE